MRKITAISMLISQLPDTILMKEFDAACIENPDWNVLWKILEDISQFVRTTIWENYTTDTRIRLVNTDAKELSGNKYTRNLPAFSPITRNIYIALAWWELSFTDASYILFLFFLAHEYGHSMPLYNEKNKLKAYVKNIIDESRSDYLGGWFLRDCYNRWVISEVSEIHDIIRFFSIRTDSLKTFGFPYDENIFYSIEDDIHWTFEHRSAMVKKWFYSWSKQYFLDSTNFQPEEIVSLSRWSPASIWKF